MANALTLPGLTASLCLCPCSCPSTSSSSSSPRALSYRTGGRGKKGRGIPSPASSIIRSSTLGIRGAIPLGDQCSSSLRVLRRSLSASPPFSSPSTSPADFQNSPRSSFFSPVDSRNCSIPIRSQSPVLLSGMTRSRRLLRFQSKARAGEGEGDEGATVKDMEGSEFWSLKVLGTVGLALFGLGFILGPLLDAIHSRVQLQIYDNGAIDVLGLHTNVWVFPLLGLFYSVTGLLQLVLDKQFAPRDNVPTASLTKVAASFTSLALLLELSAEMYKGGVPFNIEGYVLFFCAELNWLLLENTWWGFGLAALVGVACPIAEIPIIKAFDLWHYPSANISLFGKGFITWVICCYFFYTPFISNLARWLLSQVQKKETPKLRP